MFCLIQGYTNLVSDAEAELSHSYYLCYLLPVLSFKGQIRTQQMVQQPQVSSASWDLQDVFGIFSASRFCATKVYIQLHYKLCYLDAGLSLRLILTP